MAERGKEAKEEHRPRITRWEPTRRESFSFADTAQEDLGYSWFPRSHFVDPVFPSAVVVLTHCLPSGQVMQLLVRVPQPQQADPLGVEAEQAAFGASHLHVAGQAPMAVPTDIPASVTTSTARRKPDFLNLLNIIHLFSWLFAE